jgi:CRISPR-associated endonuclease Csn1
MEKILGLDLGTNSIGWAIRDTSETENQIIDKGVLTFDKGVGEGKSGEFPLVQKRTESRSKRRNYQAEKYRKWALLETLIEQKLCPLTVEELDEWRKYTKGVGRKYPQSDAFIQWLRFDFDGDGKPDFERLGFSKHESYYLFRMLIVSDEEQHREIFQDNPQILGRVLYQLVQRRGYRGRDDEDEEAKTILKGSEKNGTKGVEAIMPLIQEYQTLGAALYHLSKDKNERIRKRYNLRTDYEHELKEICRVQNLNDLFYKKLWKAIVWQRPLRSQKGLVGYCTLETPAKNESNKFIKAGKKRCPVSHPLYEEFRTWVFINNLKIKLPENIDKTTALKENIYPLFYKSSRDFKLSSINKELRKLGGSILSKHSKGSKNKEDDTKVISCTLLNSFKDALGDDWKEKHGWEEVLFDKIKPCKYSFEDIWHILFTFNSKEKLKEFAIEKLGIDEELSEKFSKIKLQQGYATLSLSAIKKILPYLYHGFIYSEAVYLANLHKVLGKDIKIDDGLIKTFSSEIEKIIKQQNHDKQLINIVNSLISDQINSGFAFSTDADYQLTDDDKNEIEKKIISAFGASTWNDKTETEKQENIEYISKEYLTFLQSYRTMERKETYLKSERLHDKIFDYLKDIYDVPEENKKHLWHPSEQETYEEATTKNNIPVLGKPQPISNGFKNPMALKTLHKLRGLMNYLLQEEKIDEDTRVVIEIARELNDANRRKAIEKWQRDREKENNEYKKIIDEINQECQTSYDREDKTLIDKIRLWKEQEMHCPYTGEMINMCDLFNGLKYDFEHTVPASMSFDNELKNLTIASSKYNREIKNNRIPFDCPNYTEEKIILGITSKPILSTLELMFGEITIEEKISKGENKRTVTSERTDQIKGQIDFWINESKKASTKDRKDYCIQQRHLNKFELEYWRKKLETFTIKEYKAGWRNSQLKDTQVVTKYALPFLKTVFKKVEVQKGSVTDDFRKIYKIQPRLEKKKRDKHSHHAIDAMVLTLIPSAAIRDKILFRYNEANDKNLHYHESVRQWDNFNGQLIKQSIEDETLINFQAEYRTITDTYKNVRKRGKQQFVKEKKEDGKWHYKLDESGKKISIIAKGDTIRGQLHKETFFAAIKQPQYKELNDKFIPETDGKGNFIFQKNKKRDDDIFIATKILLSDFEKLEDLEIIIDPNLKQYLKKEIQARINEGKTFTQATENLFAFGKEKDRNGNQINPLRHIRCKVKSGGGGFLNNPASIKPFKAFISKQPYKQHVYAQNGETSICAFYQSIVNEELVREIVPYSILDISKVKDKTTLDDAVEKNFEKTIKKIKHLIPLYTTLKLNQKVLFYENDMEELKTLSAKELSSRLYLIVKFEDGRISLKHHLNSMSEEDLKKEMKRLSLADVGASSFSFSNPIPKLRISKANFNFAIEGKHFEIKPNGEINWQF